MSLKLLIIISGVILLVVINGIAGDESEKVWNDFVQIQHDRQEIRQTGATLVKISHFIDLWHDAALKGNNSLMYQRQREIIEIIQSDLAQSYRYLDKNEKDWDQSVNQDSKKSLGNDGVQKTRAEVWNKQVDLKEARSIVKTKQYIAGAISRTTAFSNKFRLLGDYQELLRKELNINHIELAENVIEVTEDIPEE